MLSSKQRATLRSMANGIDTIMQVGKDGVTDNLITTIDDALEARELIKLKVLDNSAETPRSAAESLAQATGADVVCTVGTKFVLYRESKKKKKIII
ncbi:MAG: ribosome assembly RNA-binding protein YhbY [Clostridia bacterium]|nr:ribosome assembly RNA-binding protein YhbY [Clostridia bacterium]